MNFLAILVTIFLPIVINGPTIGEPVQEPEPAFSIPVVANCSELELDKPNALVRIRRDFNFPWRFCNFDRYEYPFNSVPGLNPNLIVEWDPNILVWEDGSARTTVWDYYGTGWIMGWCAWPELGCD